MQAIDGSLERFGLDFVDLLFCHRSDPNTPIEETVWAMSDIIASGKALYWGDVRVVGGRDPRGVGDRRAPPPAQAGRRAAAVQPLRARRVEREYARVFEDLGIGTTIWSPLASGLLTGKYIDGVPDDSRAALPGYEWLRDGMTNDDAQRAGQAAQEDRRRARVLASAQLSIAWCATNPNVSTVILGASRSSRSCKENLGALDVLPKLTDEVVAKIEEIF